MFERLTSTNDHAREMLDRHALVPPAIVLARHQSAGRGRGANTWWSGQGCLTLTFALTADPRMPIEQVPLFAGVALRRAVLQLTTNDRVQLKWPNDLMFEGRKLAGILCERHRGVDLIGIGLNVAPVRVPAALRTRLAALRDLSPRRLEPRAVLDALASNLWELFRPAHRSFAHIRREYDTHHALLGCRITVERAGGQPLLTGRCHGLDERGRLLVHDSRRLHAILTGSIRHVSPRIDRGASP